MAKRQYIICDERTRTIFDIITFDDSTDSWTHLIDNYIAVGVQKIGHMPRVRGDNKDYGKHWYLSNGYK